MSSLVLVILAIPCSTSLAQPHTICSDHPFDSALLLDAHWGPSAVTLNDFNSDGYLDLAVANAETNDLSIILADGQGGFTPATHLSLGSSPSSIAAGDFDGDGITDLVVSQSSVPNLELLIGDGAGGFGPGTLFSVGAGQSSVASGDFDGDGNLDLATANSNATIAVLLGNGQGSFAPAVITALVSTSLAVADFDGDGNLDLAAAFTGVIWPPDPQNLGSVSVLLGNGNGGFGTRTTYGTGWFTTDVVTSDFNLDGIPDLAVANSGDGDLSIFLGNAQGAMMPAGSIVAGSEPRALEAGDFNQDGFADLAVANFGYAPYVPMWEYEPGEVSIVLGDGSGGFGLAAGFSVGDGNPTDLAIGDINGDGQLDVALSEQMELQFVDGKAACIFGLGNGRLRAAQGIGTGANPRTLVAGDFNADNFEDLITGGDLGISLHLGNGQSGFAALPPAPTGGQPRAVAKGHFNADGILDLAVANAFSDDVSILMGNTQGIFTNSPTLSLSGTPSAIGVADFNSDGNDDIAVVDGFSSLSLFLANGPGTFQAAALYTVSSGPQKTMALADFNNDGAPDIAIASATSISLLPGSPLGPLGLPTTFAAGFTNPRALATSDLNFDGNADLVAVDNAGAWIYLGDGIGSFSYAGLHAAGIASASVTIADVNLDTYADLVLGNELSNDVSVLAGDGLGGFGPSQSFSAGGLPTAVTTGDFDRDGNLDLAVANEDTSSISVLTNTCSDLTLAISQPTGGTGPLFVHNFNLKPGCAYFNIFSTDLCPGGPGTGPALSLGLCIATPATAQLITDQLLMPIGTTPFHFQATGPSITFGPYPPAPFVNIPVEVVCFELNSGVIGAVSSVISYTVP